MSGRGTLKTTEVLVCSGYLADLTLKKIIVAMGFLLVFHVRFPDIFVAQTAPCQAHSVMDPVTPALHR